MTDIDLLFSGAGGKFSTPVKDLQQKLVKARAIVFDWDGVFNPGIKHDGSGSTFTEPDAMGINLLRLSFWLRLGKIPPTAVFSGEENKPAQYLAHREHFNAVYFKSKDKIKSLQHFTEAHHIRQEEVVFVFDDVLDLGLAAVCGVRMQVNRKASPLLNQWVARHGLADYVTAHDGSHFAVREVCELIMGLTDSFDAAIRERMNFSDSYQQYLSERQSVATRTFYQVDGAIRESIQ